MPKKKAKVKKKKLLTKKERSEIARKGAVKRWKKVRKNLK